MKSVMNQKKVTPAHKERKSAETSFLCLLKNGRGKKNKSFTSCDHLWANPPLPGGPRRPCPPPHLRAHLHKDAPAAADAAAADIRPNCFINYFCWKLVDLEIGYPEKLLDNHHIP